MIERIAGMVAQVSAAIGADANRYGGAESWALVALVFDIAVKGLLIVAAAGVAAYLLRGASSAVRHFVWTLAAAALVALPVLALAMPRWQVAVPGLVRADRPASVEMAVTEATIHELHVAKSHKIIVVPGHHTGSTVIVGGPDVVVIERPKAPHAPVPPAWPTLPGHIRVEPWRPARTPRAWSSPSDLARQVREEARRAAEAAREEARRAVEAAREEARRAADMARAAAFEAELEAREAARAAVERELEVRARLRSEFEREDSAAALMIGAAAIPSAGSFAAALPSPPSFPGGVSWTWLAIALWLGGVAFVMIRVAVGAARVHALGRRSWTIERGWPVPLLRRLCAELGIDRSVKLLEGDSTAMPMTWGVVRPVVLLPSSTAQWPAARLEAVLRHELAHVRRLDVLTQLIAQIACALHWFNPLVWLVANRLRIEREMACDDDVIASGSPAADYAADLVELARSLRPAPATYAAIAMARPAHLKDRVHALLDDGRRRGDVRLTHAVAASGAALVLVAPLAAMAPVPGGRVAALPRAEPAVVVERPAMPSKGFRYATPDVVAPLKPAVPGAGVVIAPRISARGPLISVPRIRLPANLHAPAISAFTIAVPRLDARQETICWGRSDNTRHSSVNRDDDSYTLEWEADGCEVQVRIRGDVRFSADFSAIEWISPGGSMRLVEEAGSIERRLDIATGSEGLEYTWRVDEREAPFDAAANDWLGEMLLQLFRSAGYAANERSLWFLREHGVPGLLGEIEHLRGDYTRRIYYQAALEQGGLDATGAAQLIQRAAGQIRSDHELSRLLVAAGGRFDFNDAMRDAFLAASRTVQSDHERRRVLAAVLERGTLDALTAAALLASVAEMDSDHEKAQLLTAVGAQSMLEPALRTDYLNAAGTIHSDHEKRRVLEALIDQGSLDPANLTSFLDVASTIRSDHETSQLLTTLAATDLSDPALQSAYLRAISTIASDHDHRRALTTVLNAGRLAPEVVSMVLRSALEIQSDHETAELLLLVLKTQELDGEGRAEFLRVLETIDSAHDHGRVSSALLRLTAGG